MNKGNGVVALILVCGLLSLLSCNKTEGPSGEAGSQRSNDSAMQSAVQELEPFKGCIEPGMLSQEKALEYLQILASGDHTSIDYYREFEIKEENKGKGSGEMWYQNDVCAAVKVLSKENNPEAYDLILKIIEQKEEYPKAVVCAIRGIMIYGNFSKGIWHGDTRSVPVLKKVINSNDPDVRLNAAGALLSLGEGGTALPVIDELVKSGAQQSIPAINKLFSPEEKEVGGAIKIVRSNTRMFDDRGRDILLKALNYSRDDVKALAALRLVNIGIERKRAEDAAIIILRQRTGTDNKGYKNADNRQQEKAAIINAITVLEETAGSDSEDVIKAFADSSFDRSLRERAIEALDIIKQKNIAL